MHSSGALREGLLYDLLGRIQHQDIREATLQSIAERYHVDLKQAQRVEETASLLAKQCAAAWNMEESSTSQWLRWAALAHEIGLVIAHSQYHKHGAYLLEYADLPGFSQRDQRILALLVRHHRRKLRKTMFENIAPDHADHSIRLIALLRLSVLLHRSRSQRNTRDIRVTATSDSIKLIFPDDWIKEHPLTTADLDAEKKNLAAVGIKLKIA